MEVISNIKYLHISPKKMREIAAAVIGFSPQSAIDRLTILENKAARILMKTIKSAKANAINNLKLNEANLKIKTIEVGKGPFIKRWQPVSRGMAHQIKKRTTHLRIVLAEMKKEERISHGTKS